ncbi:unnamed protein product [Caenorhabditis brenneri]
METSFEEKVLEGNFNFDRDIENSQLLDSTQPLDDDDDDDDPDEKELCNPLISMIVFLVVLLIAMLVLVGLWKMEVTKRGPIRKECKTPECITLSSTLLNWQNKSVNPCDDFYEFACGNYQEHTTIDGTRINEKDRIVMKLLRREF